MRARPPVVKEDVGGSRADAIVSEPVLPFSSVLEHERRAEGVPPLAHRLASSARALTPRGRPAQRKRPGVVALGISSVGQGKAVRAEENGKGELPAQEAGQQKILLQLLSEMGECRPLSREM